MTDITAAPSHRRCTAADPSDHSEGMSYLETIPRRLVTLYLPLSCS